VLRQAAATGLLARADKGLDTLIGEGGVKVSGGEKQRLERAPAFEVFEPRHRESMGSTPGAVEVRRCTGGMSSSGKKKEKRDKEKKDGVA